MAEEGEEELHVPPAVIFKILLFWPHSLFMCCLILRKKREYLHDLINLLVLRLKTNFFMWYTNLFPYVIYMNLRL